MQVRGSTRRLRSGFVLGGTTLLNAAFVVSALAQVLFHRHAYAAGVASTLLAVALVWAYARETSKSSVSAQALRPSTLSSVLPHRPVFVALAAVGLILTLALEWWDRFDGCQLISWTLAVVALNIAYSERRQWPRLTGEYLIVGILVVAALVLRVYGLESIPGGLLGVEGEFGVHALSLLDGARVRPFDVTFIFHPTLFTYLQAGAMALTGRDVAGLRLVSAIAGGCTVLPWYLFLRRAGGRWLAVTGAVLLAVSPWHVHESRMASNNVFITLCTVISMGALYCATRSGRAATYMLAGTSLGLSIYFGPKTVLLPPMMIAGLAGLMFLDRSIVRQWRLWLLCLATGLCVSAPQLFYDATHGWYGPFLSHPLGKMVSVRTEGSGSGVDVRSVAALFARQVERSLLRFHYYRDRAAFFYMGGGPLLALGEATLYLVGFTYCLWRWRLPLHVYLVGWFLVGLVALVMSQDPPQAQHIIGIATLPAGFAAIAVNELRRRWRSALAPRVRIGDVLAGLLTALVAGQALRQYFIVDPRHWLMLDITVIARAMRDLGPTHELVLVTPPFRWGDNPTARFIAYGITAAETLQTLEPGAQWVHSPTRDVAFIIDGHRRAALDVLRARYPKGILRERYGPRGELLVATYEVSHAEIVAEPLQLKFN